MSPRATQRHRLALLALLAATPTGWTRDKLLAMLWPESPAERARSSLSESVYVLRGALGEGAIVSAGDELRLGDAVRSDVREFAAAIARGDPAAAVGLYGAPFLDGFFVSRAPAFERWAEGERDRLAREYRTALERLAADAGASGDARQAVHWWRRLAGESPYDTRVASRLMEALVAAGDRAGALEHARIHRALLRSEFDLEPEPTLAELEARIRSAPTTVERSAVAHGANASQQAHAPAAHDDADDATAVAPAAPVAERATEAEERRVVASRWRPRALLATGVLAVGAAALAVTLLVVGRAPRPAATRSPPVAAGQPVTLAVLPFRVLAPRAGDDYVAIGIPDVVITRLASSHDVRVRPTSAILPYASSSVDARTAGRALAVRYVLTGTVARADSAVRVRAQLVGVDDGDVVWGGEYRLAVAELASLEDSIARDVLAALRLAPAHGGARAAALPRTNGAAYDLYLEGRARLARHREAETRAAVAAFEGAIDRDSAFALAHAGLATASAEMQLRFASTEQAPEWGERAEAEARRALQLDPALPEAHEALAAVYRKAEFDWHGTIVESRRALALNPSAAMPHFYVGGALYHLGLLDDAEREVRAGLEAQPVSDRVEALRTLGTIALAGGRYAEAVSLLQAVQRMSDRPVSDPHLAAAYFYAGDTARAVSLLEGLMGSASGSAASRARALLASILASRGERARAESLVAAAERGTVDHHVAYSLGVAYAQLGRPADAVRWIRTAWDTGLRCYPWLARDPLLAPVRETAEFRALMEELRASWAQEARWYHGL